MRQRRGMWCRASLLAAITSLALAACGPGQVFGPTLTPTPSATATPTATLVPMPADLEHLPDGLTAIRLEDGEWGLSLTVEGGLKPVDGAVYRDNALEVTLADGTKVEASVPQLTTWDILGEKHLVLNDADSIPQYRFVEGQGWVSAGRPDFEHMDDDELVEEAMRLGEFLSQQTDCSPGLQGLPVSTSSPELVEKGQYQVKWRTTYLGYYQMLLSDERNLPIGHINCLYFGAEGDKADDRKVFAVWGGGKLWGDTLSAFALAWRFGLPEFEYNQQYTVDPEQLTPLLRVGKRYDLEVNTDASPVLMHEDWKGHFRKLVFSDGTSYLNATVPRVLNYLFFEQRLSPSGYPSVVRQKLINSYIVPSSAAIYPADE